MKIIWSNRSIAELAAITEYIEQDDPESAERIASHIIGQAVSLSLMPRRGKPGRIVGTREIYILPWPYFVVYRVVTKRSPHSSHSAHRKKMAAASINTQLREG